MKIQIVLLLSLVVLATCVSEISAKKYLARLDRKSSAKDVQVCSRTGFRQFLCCSYRFGVRQYCVRRSYLVPEKLKTKYKDLVVCKRGNKLSTCSKFKNGQFIYQTVTKNKSKNMKFFLQAISSSVKKNKDIIRCARNGRFSTCCRFSNFGQLKYCSTIRQWLASQTKLRLTGKARKIKDVVRCVRSGRLQTCCRYHNGRLTYCVRGYVRLTSEVKSAMRDIIRCTRFGSRVRCCRYRNGYLIHCHYN